MHVRPTKSRAAARELGRHRAKRIGPAIVIDQAAGQRRRMMGLEVRAGPGELRVTRGVGAMERIGGEASELPPHVTSFDLAQPLRCRLARESVFETSSLGVVIAGRNERGAHAIGILQRAPRQHRERDDQVLFIERDAEAVREERGQASMRRVRRLASGGAAQECRLGAPGGRARTHDGQRGDEIPHAAHRHAS